MTILDSLTTENPTPNQDLVGLLGAHLIYIYANGWQYDLYVKNSETIDYRIHSGMVGGRWVKDQAVDIVRIDDDTFKLSWAEPTGTSVVVTVVPGKRSLHGVIFFPRWVQESPHKTVTYQNAHLDEMRTLRDAGPTYPVFVVSEFARITFMEWLDIDDETVISVPPSELPAGYASRLN
ncbi:phenolic acid decarboxylase [Pseudonocardia kujensis]|uniref:phenolic acid decarboxylase n=1 Tax=Pseudonocardia kujensis TaxID=1128675 RepID=UPI001E389A85|nr:phenolic acid decarboxylase [Pseudonocardia kujensis]MCE0763505.1 phenolic acid decarboxylase [Pseudonocardia kujensis]